jgi:hypothetical protein
MTLMLAGGMVGIAGNSRIAPFTREEGLDSFPGVSGASTVDLNTVPLEHIHCARAHVARQQNGDAFLLKHGGDIRFASAALGGGQCAGFLDLVTRACGEQAVLGAVSEMVIDFEVEACGNSDKDLVHFSAFVLR